jgi:lysophospholipase L1-like esterase
VALIWARWNVPVLGMERGAVHEVERTPLIEAMLTAGYLSELAAPPPAPPPADEVTTAGDVTAIVNELLADPASSLAVTVSQKATAAAEPAAATAATNAASAAVAGAATAAATAAVDSIRPELATIRAQMPRHLPKLRKWYAALANREAAPAELLVLGDSISEGVGATQLIRRWQNMLQRNLRNRLPTYGLNFGNAATPGAEWPYIPAHWGADWYVGRPSTVSGTWDAVDQFGLGQRAVKLPDDTGKVTFTFTGTSCRLLYTKGDQGAVLRVAIDGGTPVLIDSYIATGLQVGVWNSPALARGAHTVVVTRDPSSAAGRGAHVEGLVTYDNDSGHGIRVVDGAHSGSWAQGFAADLGWADSAKQVARGNDGRYAGAMMLWGTNDFGGGRSAAQFKADNQAIIAGLRARGFDSSIVLVLLWLSFGRNDAAWEDYGRVLNEIASGDPDISYFTIRDVMPDPTTGDATGSLGLYTDGVHPSDAGNGYLADLFTGYLLPRA